MADSKLGKMVINAILGAVAGKWIATIKTEVEVTKVEIKYKSRQLGIGAAFLAIAGALGFFMLLVLIAAAVLAFALILEPWAAALVVAGILLVIIVIFGAAGASKIKKNKDLMPTASIERIKKQL
ncbi:phage holin family protein [Demequina muriae]|uniref:Phage holin family protein n=1 Tax=Demequina muriae TaxID=3051664 RepID=A0ABT8GGD4_9MICO|nr:phage holin family protein [Demequina sp. EGI L300058]MDN4480319.1 phage holin family protein [Demequina sp. EGI L300058]